MVFVPLLLLLQCFLQLQTKVTWVSLGLGFNTLHPSRPEMSVHSRWSSRSWQGPLLRPLSRCELRCNRGTTLVSASRVARVHARPALCPAAGSILRYVGRKQNYHVDGLVLCSAQLQAAAMYWQKSMPSCGWPNSVLCPAAVSRDMTCNGLLISASSLPEVHLVRSLQHMSQLQPAVTFRSEVPSRSSGQGTSWLRGATEQVVAAEPHVGA